MNPLGTDGGYNPGIKSFLMDVRDPQGWKGGKGTATPTLGWGRGRGGWGVWWILDGEVKGGGVEGRGIREGQKEGIGRQGMGMGLC